jgi:hypothetical protein
MFTVKIANGGPKNEVNPPVTPAIAIPLALISFGDFQLLMNL